MILLFNFLVEPGHERRQPSRRIVAMGGAQPFHKPNRGFAARQDRDELRQSGKVEIYDRGAAMPLDEQLSGVGQHVLGDGAELPSREVEAVSYTHLTLPTKRIV